MISVIIPVYNYAQYLLQAFLSVVNECDDMEIIIVDDGSTDDIKMVIDKISRPFAFPEKIIRFISLGSNRGVSIARNAGLRISEGKYIAFLDADDMRVPGSILAQKMYLDNHENVDVVFGEALEIRGDIKYSKAINRVRKFRIHPSEVNPQTVMYRRTVFEKYGGWYEGLISGEDKEMSIRLGIHPESPFKLVKAKKLKAPMAFYRKHPNEKHKLRKANVVWNKETKRIQKDRIIQLKREGITRENTCFPI